MSTVVYLFMRIFSAFIILIISLQSWALAGDKINKLFGVKLNTDISLYANVEDGVVSDNISTSETIITFSNKTLTGIIRDPLFQYYNIRTNENYKVQVINAGKPFLFQDKKFDDNECNNEKNYFIEKLTAGHKLNSSKFKSFYRKNVDEKRNFDHLWHDTNYVYKDGQEQYRLMAICVHRLYKEKPVSNLFISWMTEQYYRKNVMKRFEIIEPFNIDFILDYLKYY